MNGNSRWTTKYIGILQYCIGGVKISFPRPFLVAVLAQGVSFTFTFTMSDLMFAQRQILGELPAVWQIGERI
jgi:hypothetical protein